MAIHKGVEEIKPERTKGEVYEGIAFQFCKIATVALIAGRFALPLAAGCCAIFYVLALMKGKRDTRCVLRYPIVLVVLWGTVAVWSLVALLKGGASNHEGPGIKNLSQPDLTRPRI